ncbi:MAG TPA: sensor domain-containing diguanylate cyclase [Terracidiphilus sp.]|nr:sensor domain-containing diguanylate cyclase [Terracidiphilus sp.]
MICQVEIVNGVHRFVYASPSTPELVGWSVEEVLEMSLAQLYTSESIALIKNDAEKLLNGHQTSLVTVEAIRKDGSHVWMENKVRLLSNRNGAMSVIICSRDITQRKLFEDRLARLALLDGLTGIFNRRAFDDTIKREWKRAVRTRSPLSLLLLDVDNFKLYNDTYGHQQGDDCLRSIAETLSHTVKRAEDMVSRYGGEEFAVLLPATEMAGAELLAQRLCNAVIELRIPHLANLCAGQIVSVSCGASTAIGRSGNPVRMPEGLLVAADCALYRAKRQGRNCVASSFLEPRDESYRNLKAD